MQVKASDFKTSTRMHLLIHSTRVITELASHETEHTTYAKNVIFQGLAVGHKMTEEIEEGRHDGVDAARVRERIVRLQRDLLSTSVSVIKRVSTYTIYTG